MATESKLIGLICIIAMLLSDGYPALVKSFEVIEQHNADAQLRSEIAKAKATQDHLRATGQIE
jgi:hypothetical protein